MTNNRPNIDPTARFELRETAAVLATSKSSILRWTSQGILRCGGIRRNNGRKFWLGADIIRFWCSQM